MNVPRPIILTFVSHYLPGYASGGPVRSIENLVQRLGGEFDFRIVTKDRDLRGVAAYADVNVDQWNEVGEAQVYYASNAAMSIARMRRLLDKTPYDLVYLNSFFSMWFSTIPLMLRRLRSVNSPILLAPRGVFSKGALSLKSWKKSPYIAAMKALRLYRDVTWQASSEHEANDINRVIGQNARVVIAPNVPSLRATRALEDGAHHVRSNPLSVLFVSRISPKKNLRFALRVLTRVRVPLQFVIVGPVTDERYWQGCRKLIDSLPDHVTVRILGGIENYRIRQVMAENDLFFLPTLGENYGHVIAEALSAGVPLLISDRTPWRRLQEAGLGWDLPLSSEELFVEAIETAASKTDLEYRHWRTSVAQYAFNRFSDPAIVQANRRLFASCLGG